MTLFKVFRFLLFPFSALWWLFATIRNTCYDNSILTSIKIQEKSIVIGNLSTGGTGKSPMTIYLTNLFKESINVQLLSRGYGRSSKGYLKVNETHSVVDVGDEPLLFSRRFNNEVNVAVSEDRLIGIQKLRELSSRSLIILDDAYQHRKVKGGFSILLTSYNSIFVNDYLLPVGNLREPRVGAKRADVIVVTKCPKSIDENKKSELKNSLSKYGKPVFFSSIRYSKPIYFGNSSEISTNVLLVTGIANPKPLIQYLAFSNKIEHISFPDHHNFTEKEIKEIHEKIDTFVNEKWSIITTEKDYMRLLPYQDNWDLSKYPWFYIPIDIEIENKQEFNQLLINYVVNI